MDLATDNASDMRAVAIAIGCCVVDKVGNLRGSASKVRMGCVDPGVEDVRACSAPRGRVIDVCCCSMAERRNTREAPGRVGLFYIRSGRSGEDGILLDILNLGLLNLHQVVQRRTYAGVCEKDIQIAIFQGGGETIEHALEDVVCLRQEGFVEGCSRHIILELDDILVRDDLGISTRLEQRCSLLRSGEAKWQYREDHREAHIRKARL